jgi:F-actin capping protein, beta subunit
MPSESLRKLEIDANHAFDQYRDMYFEGGVSSVYLWDLDHGFAGIQKLIGNNTVLWDHVTILMIKKRPIYLSGLNTICRN